MSWIAITKDTLNEASIAALIEACDSAALADGQANRAAGLIQGVVTEIRAAVATAKGNQVDSDEAKIPGNLRDLAVDMIIARLKQAISRELSQDERDNLAWRRRQLDKVAAGELAVAMPDVPVKPEVQGGPAVELVRPGRDPESRTLGGFI